MGTSHTRAQVPWRIARFGMFEVDTAAGELRKSGVRRKLQDQPFQILVMLLTAPGEIVTRDTLRDSLWPADTFVEFDHSLNTAVKKLRQALGDDADNPRFIETIPRKGYKFIAPVQFHAERSEASTGNATTASLADEAIAPLPRVYSHTHSRITRISIGGLIMLAVVATLAYLLPLRNRPNSGPLKVRPLTWYPGEEVTPALSPDGTRVAFAWNKGEKSSLHIYVKVIGTEDPIAITSGNTVNAFPAWSSDGRYIAFRRLCLPFVKTIPLVEITSCGDSPTGIYLVPSIGGPERLLHATARVAANGQMSFSPDGKQLAFADVENGRWGIYLLSVDDLSVRRLTDPVSAAGDTEPAFSPDGKWVAFSRDTKDAPRIYVVPVTGGAPRKMSEGNDNPVFAGLTWTQDGKCVIYGGIGLWRVCLADGTREQILPTVFSFYPSVSKTQMVFSDSTWVENVFRVSIEGTKVGRIEPMIVSSRIDQSGQFSPDGKSIVFQSTRGGSFEIYRANADGTNQIQLTHFNGPLAGTPSWTPDGKTVVFDSRPKGNADILAVSAEGGAVRHLTTDSTNEAVPSVSHDGRWLYFASDRTGTWNVFKQPFEGGTAVQLTFQGGFAPRESQDGKWVYYSKSVDQGGIWRVPATGGKEEFVVQNPDGYWGFWVLSEGGIYLVTGEGLNPSVLSYYDFDSRRITNLTKLPYPTNAGAPAMGISPDGKTILITQVVSRSSDVMLAEGLR